MIAKLRLSLRIATLAALASLLPAAMASAEEASMRVFSAWQGQGHVLQTGPDLATYIGMISGRVFVDTDQGPVDAGEMVCPIVVKVNLKSKTQEGTGQCTMTGTKGNRVYLDLKCTGVPLVGCAGESTLTGGTGPFAQVTGGGHFVIRSSEHELVGDPDASMKDTTSGIIFWRDLHYKTP
jgi:hypothetical protein